MNIWKAIKAVVRPLDLDSTTYESSRSNVRQPDQPDRPAEPSRFDGQQIGGQTYIDPYQDRIKPNIAATDPDSVRRNVPGVAGDLTPARTGIRVVEQGTMEPDAGPHTGGEGPHNP